MTSDIDLTTRQLYEAFAAYPLKHAIQVCPHCHLEASESALHERPLREMRWKDFGVYPFKAITTFGDIDDFKHFLPRLLELYLLDHDTAPYDASVLFAKLNEAGWSLWPTLEVAAVRAFVAAWQQALSTRVHESDRQSWQLEELRAALSESGFPAPSAA